MPTSGRLTRATSLVLIALSPLVAFDALAGSAGAVGDTDDGVHHPATAQQTAQRGDHDQPTLPAPPRVDNPLLDGCDAALVQRLMESNPASSQWIIVTVPNATATTGILQIATVRDDVWQCTLAPTTAQVGANGIRPLVDRRSGDGTTPAGIFGLGVVASPQGPISFFGNSANPGTLGPYRRIQPGDCYGANPNTPGYGHWRVDSVTCTGDDELLERNVTTYEHAVLIGANTEPNVSGDSPGEVPYAAAIFLHRTATTSSGAPKPTSGCVSIGHSQLVTAMRTIDPALNPRFAIGTRSVLLATPVSTTRLRLR